MAVSTRSHRVYRLRRKRVRRLLFFLLTVVALYYFINSGFFSLDNIIIKCNRDALASELEPIIGVEKGTNIWRVDTGAVERRIETHPLVAASRVKRVWPSTLTIEVQERIPAAILVQNGEFLLVDKEGVVMQRVNRIGHLDLPLISGIEEIENAGPGKEIMNPLLKAALVIVRQVPAETIKRIKEIKAGSPESFELIWEGNIPVKFGDELNVTAKINRIYEALQGLVPGEPIEYIDVSYEGPPVVKFKK